MKKVLYHIAIYTFAICLIANDGLFAGPEQNSGMLNSLRNALRACAQNLTSLLKWRARSSEVSLTVLSSTSRTTSNSSATEVINTTPGESPLERTPQQLGADAAFTPLREQASRLHDEFIKRVGLDELFHTSKSETRKKMNIKIRDHILRAAQNKASITLDDMGTMKLTVEPREFDAEEVQMMAKRLRGVSDDALGNVLMGSPEDMTAVEFQKYGTKLSEYLMPKTLNRLQIETLELLEERFHLEISMRNLDDMTIDPSLPTFNIGNHLRNPDIMMQWSLAGAIHDAKKYAPTRDFYNLTIEALIFRIQTYVLPALKPHPELQRQLWTLLHSVSETTNEPRLHPEKVLTP